MTAPTDLRTAGVRANTFDDETAAAFAGRIAELVTGATQTFLIEVGRRTGLFGAAAALGPATSTELAASAGLQERYVREWLGAMVTGGIFEYDPSSGRSWLPREHAASLTGEGVDNVTPIAFLVTSLARNVPAVAAAFRQGGGVPYAAYLPELHDVMEALWGPIYRDQLVDAIVPLVPGLAERLVAGVRVADIACGTGLAAVTLAAAYPASRFVGYDLDASAIEQARATAAVRGLANVSFEVRDAATLTVEEPFDVVLVFNAIHDQAAPATVLGRIHDALVPGGTFVMDEPRLSGRLEADIEDPVAPLLYGISVLHCLTVSLAQGGAGLGTAWGEHVARQLVADAGFELQAVHELPGDPGSGLFVARRP
jgi:SAM-dependent methyltransferase